jgi:MinD-like ATPase involved in chromosome partitioning or flagellar assembly
MSLVNVGVQLAQAGKKVLLVDFDLEAPGLPSFELERPDIEVPGVVDFVTDYLESGQSPDVSGYIYKSNKFSESGGEIWVMPVGRHDADYSHRLNAIDWKSLYTERDGYLLFEDLKHQWQKIWHQTTF